MRYEQRAEHAGIHANPDSGNHPGTVALTKELVEILTNPHTYHEGGGGGGGERGSKSTPQADSMLKATALPHRAATQHTSALQNPV